jgi:hypothetical protein
MNMGVYHKPLTFLPPKLALPQPLGWENDRMGQMSFFEI